MNWRCLASSCTSFSRSSRTSHISVHSSPSGESIQSENSSIKGLLTKTVSSGCSLRCLPMRWVLTQVWAFEASLRLHAAALAQRYPCCRQGAGTRVASDLRNANRRHADAQLIWFVTSYPDHEHYQG